MEIVIIQGVLTLLGIGLTGFFSTKSAIINSNARQAKTEQKAQDAQEQIQKELSEVRVRLDELSETDSCCATLQKDVINLKKENGLTMRAMLACLDGLEQLGCNHSVTKTKKDLENWLNELAHV